MTPQDQQLIQAVRQFFEPYVPDSTSPFFYYGIELGIAIALRDPVLAASLAAAFTRAIHHRHDEWDERIAEFRLALDIKEVITGAQDSS